MVAMCLVKDQTKRPTAEKLLKHPFFKQAKAPELSLKDTAQLALKKMPSVAQEAISQHSNCGFIAAQVPYEAFKKEIGNNAKVLPLSYWLHRNTIPFLDEKNLTASLHIK
ncbi:hypothetical protein L2E82_17220 [Cichorium intybus]|uniref:Uncharacterized protein n=1 Tax=Cichorium intybus TaxID=13427 RepID=A0ACB9F7Q9_CICIN|nr:hypothetical protein L2E82_17220 [Cichorium intybus]